MHISTGQQAERNSLITFLFLDQFPGFWTNFLDSGPISWIRWSRLVSAWKALDLSFPSPTTKLNKIIYLNPKWDAITGKAFVPQSGQFHFAVRTFPREISTGFRISIRDILTIQVKAYLQSEEFRLKFCRESVTLRRFWLCRFPRHDFKWNPWLLVLFTMILAKKQFSTVLDLICTSQ